MERYSEYKDSGVYFLPRLPKEWKIRKAKYLFNEEYRPTRPDDEIVTCFRDGQVTLRKNRRIEGFTNSLKEIGYQGVRKGDLVIHNMDAFAGSIGVSDSDGKATPVYSCCTPKSDEVNQYYYCLLLRCLARNGFILSLAKGIRERSTDFRFNDFKELYLPLPSRREQDAIVAYLDKVTSKIDAAIAQQQKMIELLNERKQIIINNAVTKGLDPTAKMKPSGIPWLGNIPAHWEVRKLKYLTTQVTTPSSSTNKIGLENIESGTGEYIQTETIFEGNGIEYKLGDILYGKLRPYLRKVYLAKDDGNAIGDFYVLRPNTEITPIYLQHILLSQQLTDVINSSTYGAKMPRVSIDFMGSLYLPLPPFNEQEHISSTIARNSIPLNKQIDVCKKKIAFFQERKQIIINDVVTGKVKVI